MPTTSEKQATLLVLDPDWYSSRNALETAIDGNKARAKNSALPMFVLRDGHFNRIRETERGFLATKVESTDGEIYWRPEDWLDA